MKGVTPPRDAALEAALDRAAELMLQADALIVAAGAGMGVDSGLPDFRGREGFWQAYPALGRAGLGGNPAVAWALGACLLLQLAFVYLPPLQAVFGTTALGAREWVAVGSAGLGVFVVAELEKVTKSFDTGAGIKTVVRDFSCTILRGDKVGLMGPNGAGKTTLLKLILGELEADSGEVRRGTKMEVAYFDQMRDALDLNATLEDFISPGSEWIEIGNKRQHVKSYLGDFLFSPARATSPVRSLSGGERNRLLLARLFARPANVLVLDEPTNDLDIETLELLEELLQTYEGTVFLVSHDRAFMDNVVTGIIACESAPDQPGFWREYEGSVQDWLVQSKRAQAIRAQTAQRSASAPQATTATSTAATPAPAAPATAAPARSKLSYKEQRELAELPGKIEALEKEQTETRAQLADGSVYQRDPGLAQQLFRRDTEIDDLLLAAMERWEILSAR